jgi:hypothetical protein
VSRTTAHPVKGQRSDGTDQIQMISRGFSREYFGRIDGRLGLRRANSNSRRSVSDRRVDIRSSIASLSLPHPSSSFGPKTETRKSSQRTTYILLRITVSNKFPRGAVLVTRTKRLEQPQKETDRGKTEATITMSFKNMISSSCFASVFLGCYVALACFNLYVRTSLSY